VRPLEKVPQDLIVGLRLVEVGQVTGTGNDPVRGVRQRFAEGLTGQPAAAKVKFAVDHQGWMMNVLQPRPSKGLRADGGRQICARVTCEHATQQRVRGLILGSQTAQGMSGPASPDCLDALAAQCCRVLL